MLKVGFVSPFLPEKDGIAIYSDNILRGLGNKNENIIKIGRLGSKKCGSDYVVNFKSLKLGRSIERIVKKERLDAVHFQYVPTLFGKRSLNYSMIRALKLSVPTIVTLHEVHYSVKNVRERILAHIEGKIVKSADLIVVHTPRQKEFLERKYNAKNVVLVYHGLRLNKFPTRKTEKNLLCFGMISQGKGLPYLIRAMDHLPGYKLKIAGRFVDKKAEIEVRNALKRSKLGNIEADFGWIDEDKKEGLFKWGAIMVLPHIWAPYQSGILHNAVAWGMPVVASRTGALYEMVELFKFGIVVKPRSPKSIASGVKKVAKDYKKLKKGVDSYRKVANWQRISKEHMSLYSKLVEKK